MTLERVLILSAVIFSIGLYGFLTKRNAITMLMAIELMFNGVTIAINFIDYIFYKNIQKLRFILWLGLNINFF